MDKNIDESWKDTVEQEKEKLQKDGKFVAPVPDFNFFVSTLALQCSIFLGKIPNPATNKIEEDRGQARFLIETLDMLKEKTKGNLTKEELDLLENLLYELRMQYVSGEKKEEGQ